MGKLVKGMIIGSMVGATWGMLSNGSMNSTKKKIMKKGRQMANKMNMI